MEIVFNKTKKVLLSLVLTLLFISISTTIFAANTFRLNIASATMYEGKEFQLTANNKKVIWTSSDPSKATVDSNGNVKAIKKGKVTITAENNGEKHSCEIKINKQSFIDKLRGVTMNASAVTVYEGENIVLKTGKTGDWKTTSKYAATVVAGRVAGNKPGIAIISQKVGNKTATCWVTVKKGEKIEKVDDVKLEISSLEWVDSFTSGGGTNYRPSYTISDSKDSFFVNYGTVKTNEYGQIYDLYENDDESIAGITDVLGATFEVKVTNKGNKPVQLSIADSGTGMEFAFLNYLEGFTIEDEVLDAGASCTFLVACTTGENPPNTETAYTDGFKLTAKFSIKGTEYTGKETPKKTHFHQPSGGV